MRRTRQRPLPDGRLSAVEALAFAGILSVIGLFVLAAGVNLLSAAVALATLASYAVVYTPLKRRTSFATVIGAIPGALPPVIGWAAADNALSQGAWVLFGIVFLWQLPHFLAIAWIHREDYACRSSDAAGHRTGWPRTRVRRSSIPPRCCRWRWRRRWSAWPGPSTSPARCSSSCLLGVSVRFADARRARRPAAVLRLHHLPSAALGADDRDRGPPAKMTESVSTYRGLHSCAQRVAECDRDRALAGQVIRRGRIGTTGRAWLRRSRTGAVPRVYLTYRRARGSGRFPGKGPIGSPYFAILISHIVLRLPFLPLAVITLAA